MDALVYVYTRHPSLCTCAPVRPVAYIFFDARKRNPENSKPRVCFPLNRVRSNFGKECVSLDTSVYGGIACPDGTGSTNFNFHYTPLPDSVDVFPKYAKRLIWISMVISTLYAFPPPSYYRLFPSSHSSNTSDFLSRATTTKKTPSLIYSLLLSPSWYFIFSSIYREK